MLLRKWLGVALALTLIGACSSDPSEDSSACPVGTEQNPITSECVSIEDAGDFVDVGDDMSDTATVSPDAAFEGDMEASIDAAIDMSVADIASDMPPAPACGPVAAGCDDGLSCTTDSCVDAVCEHIGGDCDWPAEAQNNAVNMTSIDSIGFGSDLSGIVYNPLHPRLWIVRNNGPSRVWSLVRDQAGAWQIDQQGADLARWFNFGDAEGIALADFDNEFQVLVVSEDARVIEYDFSDFTAKTELNNWRLPELGGSGAEGLTFVPDAALAAGGFVDAAGDPYTSTEGMGGLVFVAHQSRGQLYVFDLNRQTGTYVFVGEYDTSRDESSGLEWDGSTGQLMVWHDSGHDELEIVRLSSSAGAGLRRFDTMVIYAFGATGLGISRNFEGIAVEPVTECVDGRRKFYMTTDGGNSRSLFRYDDFSC